MNKVIHKLLFAVLMCGAMTLTSCDELLGTEPDNPSNKVPDEMAETVKLLEQAQQEGALVAITFTYNSEQYQAVFKKVANEYVLQDPSAARTRARLVLPADDGLVVILTDNDIEKGILTFTATNAKTNECVLQAQIDTGTCDYRTSSPNNQATLDDFSVCSPESNKYSSLPISPTKNKKKNEADYLIRNQKYYICEYIVADGNIAQVMLSDKSEQSISHAPACAREAT